MSRQDDNKAVVGRWFTEFWGRDLNLAVVDEIAAPDMLLKYSLHAPRRGRDDIKSVHDRLSRGVPRSQLLGDGRSDRRGRLCRRPVGGRRNPCGSCLQGLPRGALPPATGRTMRFTGTTVLKVIDGRIAEEVGLDDGVTALTQLGLLKAAA